MAAQEYYSSFAPHHQQTSQPRPTYQQSPQNSFSHTFAPSPAPYNNELAPYIPPQNQGHSSSPLQQSYMNPPYPEEGSPRISTPQPLAQNYRPQYQQQQQQSYYQPNQSQLGPPLAPQRSYSSPADPRHVRFSEDRGRRRASVYSSDSESDASSRSRSRSRSRREERRRTRRQSDNERKRDTFLGAGGGALIGDAIFPGAGTLGGLLLGGLGGREYARRRSRSELPPRRDSRDEEEHHKHEKRYRDGITVKSGIIRR